MTQQNNPPFDSTSVRAIIGLGNPGTKFVYTRHNVGFRVVDLLARRWGLSWRSTELMEVASGKVILIRPQTFMNASGKVVPFLQKKGIRPEQIVVVHDELEKKLGHISVKLGGSARGHNGLRSIIGMIGADFWRLRIGIGRPESKHDVGNYVLRPFLPDEQDQVEVLIEKAADVLDPSRRPA